MAKDRRAEKINHYRDQLQESQEGGLEDENFHELNSVY